MNEKRKEKMAQEILDWFIKWTKDLEPEYVLGCMECFKAVYLDRYITTQKENVRKSGIKRKWLEIYTITPKGLYT